MSAIEDLRKLDADWTVVETWLNGPKRHYASDGDRSDPGELVVGAELKLNRLPTAVLHGVTSEIEETVRALARKHYKYVREKLVNAARADAQKLLEELGPMMVVVEHLE